MVVASARWRFISPVSDQVYFEDDLVQHVVIEHRAVRRSFSEKFCQDAAAVASVREQTRLAAQAIPPALPRIYGMEETKGRLSIISELIEGLPFEILLRDQTYSKARDWATFALQLVDELLELRRYEARFERLDASHLVVSEAGDIRFTERWPIGRPSQQALDSSPFLQRMIMHERGGVYAHPGAPDERAELTALKQLLAKAAASTMKATFEGLRAEAAASPHLYPSPLARVDSPVAQLLIALDGSASDGGRPIRTLGQFREAVYQLHSNEARKQLTEMSSRADIPVRQVTSSPPPSQARSSDPPPTVTVRTAAPWATPAPTPPSSSGGGAPSSTDVAKPRSIPDAFLAPGQRSRGPQPTPPPAPARRESSGVGTPGSGIRGGAGTPAPILPATRPSDTGVHKLRLTDARRSRALVVATVVLVGALLAGGGYFLSKVLKQEEVNTKPSAAIDPPPVSLVKMGEKIVFDAGRSADPEKKPLSYHWKLLSPANGSVLFVTPGIPARENSILTDSPKVEVQFLSLGRIELELRVNDGSFFSDPVVVATEVTGRK